MAGVDAIAAQPASLSAGLLLVRALPQQPTRLVSSPLSERLPPSTDESNLRRVACACIDSETKKSLFCPPFWRLMSHISNTRLLPCAAVRLHIIVCAAPSLFALICFYTQPCADPAVHSVSRTWRTMMRNNPKQAALLRPVNQTLQDEIYAHRSNGRLDICSSPHDIFARTSAFPA